MTKTKAKAKPQKAAKRQPRQKNLIPINPMQVNMNQVVSMLRPI